MKGRKKKSKRMLAARGGKTANSRSSSGPCPAQPLTPGQCVVSIDLEAMAELAGTIPPFGALESECWLCEAMQRGAIEVTPVDGPEAARALLRERARRDMEAGEELIESFGLDLDGNDRVS